MACSNCSLEAQLSGGDGSRITLDTEKLVRDGWSMEKRGNLTSFFLLLPRRKDLNPPVMWRHIYKMRTC